MGLGQVTVRRYFSLFSPMRKHRPSASSIDDAADAEENRARKKLAKADDIEKKKATARYFFH